MMSRHILVCLLSAWVLWYAKEDYNVGRNFMYETWTIVRSFDDLKSCTAEQDRVVKGLGKSAEFAGSKQTEQQLPDGYYAAFGMEGKVHRTIKARLLCVPGTLDPRPRFKE